MKQIFSWTVGSFFRTIGRIAAFMIIGFVIAKLVDLSGLIDSFKISDLFLENVNAEELNTYSTEWYLENGNAITSQIAGYSFQQGQNTATGSQQNFKYYFNSNKNPIGVGAGYDYLSFNIGSYIWFTTNTSNVLTETDTFTCLINSTTSSGQNSDYKYQSITCPKTYSSGEVYEQQATYFYQVRLYYGDNSYSVCDLNSAHAGGGFVKCNLSVHKDSGLKFLSVWVGVDNFDSSIGGGSYWVKFGVSKAFNVAVSTDTQINNSINSQTQQQQQNHSELMDTNSTQTDETSSSFFGNFTTEDQGGLSSIVTAPLSMINELLNGTCTQPSATWKGATISLPCGDMFWNRNGASALKDLLNVFYGGFICYYAIRKLFLMIESFKDPTNDRIEVSDL